ncbi:MAG: hypothetical protein U1F68_13350 [Gammaproteobacteria bacterium]
MGLFGGKRGDGSGGRTGVGHSYRSVRRLWSILIIGALIVWALSGFYEASTNGKWSSCALARNYFWAVTCRVELSSARAGGNR